MPVAGVQYEMAVCNKRHCSCAESQKTSFSILSTSITHTVAYIDIFDDKSLKACQWIDLLCLGLHTEFCEILQRHDDAAAYRRIGAIRLPTKMQVIINCSRGTHIDVTSVGLD